MPVRILTAAIAVAALLGMAVVTTSCSSTPSAPPASEPPPEEQTEEADEPEAPATNESQTQHGQSGSDSPARPDTVEAQVTRVVDGDTIEVSIDGKTYKVRYIGIDTPETVHPTKDVEEYGKEASAKNKEVVGGKVVDLEKDVSETDKYGRLLCYVYVDDLFVNAELVRLGYAQAVSYPPDVKYQDVLLERQREARKLGRGCGVLRLKMIQVVDKGDKMPIPKEVHMPSLGNLQRNQPALIVKLMVGQVPQDEVVHRQVVTVVRLADLSLTEYEHARSDLERSLARQDTRLGYILSATNHLELCVITVKRAMGGLRSLARNAKAPPVSREARRALEGFEEQLTATRDAVVHIAEDIMDREIGPGEPHALAVSEDGQTASIGRWHISLSDLSFAIRRLHESAKHLAEYRKGYQRD